MKPRHKRIALVIAGVAVVAIAATLILRAFNSNLVFFFTLAKHDENYMPPEAAEAIAKAHKAAGKGDTPPSYTKGYNAK